MLLDPGNAVWTEDPGYLGARGALLAAGARLVPVPVDAEGIDVEAGLRLCPQAKLASVTPSHQFPTGVTMSIGRGWRSCTGRKQWEPGFWRTTTTASTGSAGDRWRHCTAWMPTARALYRQLQQGTFSGVAPGLSGRFLALAEQFLATRRFIDVHAPLLEQMALGDFSPGGILPATCDACDGSTPGAAKLWSTSCSAQSETAWISLCLRQACTWLSGYLRAEMIGRWLAGRQLAGSRWRRSRGSACARWLEGDWCWGMPAPAEELRAAVHRLAAALD